MEAADDLARKRPAPRREGRRERDARDRPKPEFVAWGSVAASARAALAQAAQATREKRFQPADTDMVDPFKEAQQQSRTEVSVALFGMNRDIPVGTGAVICGWGRHDRRGH